MSSSNVVQILDDLRLDAVLTVGRAQIRRRIKPARKHALQHLHYNITLCQTVDEVQDVPHLVFDLVDRRIRSLQFIQIEVQQICSVMTPSLSYTLCTG